MERRLKEISDWVPVTRESPLEVNLDDGTQVRVYADERGSDVDGSVRLRAEIWRAEK